LKRLSLYKGSPPFGKRRPGKISENSSSKSQLDAKKFLGVGSRLADCADLVKTENKTQGF